MTRAIRLLASLAVLFMLVGCATQGKYSWGGYDQALYDYYKHPSDSAEYMAALRKAIDGAAAARKPVAPGICAEYGYMLLQQQKTDDAVHYFQLEKQYWPESAQFMDGMIRTAHLGNKPVVEEGAAS